MKRFTWSLEKNRILKEDKLRSVCFEDIVAALDTGGYLADIAHPNFDKYPHQRMFVVLINDYVYGVPYVETEDEIFLKTAFQSRRLKNTYLKVEPDDE
jgi:hypothetical protein